MDAFYAAIEVLDDPTLRGCPVIVGHPGPRGVVSTASYEARRFGVHSAMPSTIAQRLCPQAIWRPGRMKRYSEISRRIHEVFARFTPRVEPLSLDEAFLDVAGSEGLFGSAVDIAETIRAEIPRVTGGLTVSIGVAENKFLAKVASDLRKPNGLTVVPVGEGAAFLAPLPIEKIWGVGRRTAQRLHEINVKTIGEVVAIGEEFLVRRFGPSGGGHLWRLAHGLDSRGVETNRVAKSISQESTFETDLRDSREIADVLFRSADRVASQLRDQGYVARTVQLKARAGDFQTWTRSRTLETPTQLARPLYRTALALLETVPLEGRGLRLLGVGAKALVRADGAAVQGELFPEPEEQQTSRATELRDAIRDRFGPRAVTWGRQLDDHSPDDDRV